MSDEVRMCKVKLPPRHRDPDEKYCPDSREYPAKFHQWASEVHHYEDQPFSCTAGIVEFENGSIRLVEPEAIQFLN